MEWGIWNVECGIIADGNPVAQNCFMSVECGVWSVELWNRLRAMDFYKLGIAPPSPEQT